MSTSPCNCNTCVSSVEVVLPSFEPQTPVRRSNVNRRLPIRLAPFRRERRSSNDSDEPARKRVKVTEDTLPFESFNRTPEVVRRMVVTTNAPRRPSRIVQDQELPTDLEIELPIEGGRERSIRRVLFPEVEVPNGY